MSTSRIKGSERPGDPEGDFDGVLTNPLFVNEATRKILRKEKALRSRNKRLDAFIKADYGFVPDSRGSITVAVDNIHAQINEKYNNTPLETDPTKDPDVRKIGVVGRFYKSLLARQTFTRYDLDALAEANSPIPDKHYLPTTFNVGNLESSPRALEAVALHQLRASALATEDWTKLHSDVRGKSVSDEIEFMTTIEPRELREEQLDVRWHAAWESSVNELRFWEQKTVEAEENVHVKKFLGAHPELTLPR